MAYYGGKQIGFAERDEALERECLRQGYSDFFIRRVRPRAEADFISTRYARLFLRRVSSGFATERAAWG